jgi:hypothetical protein
MLVYSVFCKVEDKDSKGLFFYLKKKRIFLESKSHKVFDVTKRQFIVRDVIYKKRLSIVEIPLDIFKLIF